MFVCVHSVCWYITLPKQANEFTQLTNVVIFLFVWYFHQIGLSKYPLVSEVMICLWLTFCAADHFWQETKLMPRGNVFYLLGFKFTHAKRHQLIPERWGCGSLNKHLKFSILKKCIHSSMFDTVKLL